MRYKQNTDKGVAGLTILLSFVTMLFVIGLLVMIFSLMGGGLRDATYTETSITVVNESGTVFANATGYTLASESTYLNAEDYVITAVWNETSSDLVPAANYTVNTGTGNFSNAAGYENVYQVNVSYTFNYDASNTATDVMNDTVSGIANVTDWFDIFIVIMAMIVLILLTVIIITAIRGSGLMEGGTG